MSNKLVADLMSFRARMVADNRTQVMFEGDFDAIDQAIRELKQKSTKPHCYRCNGKGVIANLNTTSGWESCPESAHGITLAAPQQAIPSGWISVKDKLPENERVMTLSPAYAEGEHMRHRIMDGQFVKVCHDVSHWMPLPASPTAPIERDK
jgi:hypothetical protein